MAKYKGTESYHLSLSDLFCSVLFIFIILLVYFIIQFNEKKDNLTRPLDERSNLLKTLKKELKQRDVEVIIDENDGILRIPIGEKNRCSYFESAEYEINECGKNNFDHIKEVFKSVLKKYAYSSKSGKCDKNKKNEIDTILIEGHSDSTPLGPSAQINCPEKSQKERRARCRRKGLKEECKNRKNRKTCISRYVRKCLKKEKDCVRDNFHLSTMRAREAFKYLLDFNPKKKGRKGNELYELRHCIDISKNKKRRVFGVSGFGDSRPISKIKAENRRIDFRFIMPISDEIKKEIQEKLEKRRITKQ